jgi:hypothetical protein
MKFIEQGGRQYEKRKEGGKRRIKDIPSWTERRNPFHRCYLLPPKKSREP